ncbi:DUF1015 domain-containing protein [Candidatus Sumerlaeota bacterium]|nr:DUF1015 domain-containing protein [Candidatus Sumerlaeota bacterium]
MAEIKPFIASRYAPPLRAELDKLLTPPYDVITPAMQEAFYTAHPKNLVRVDFGKEAPGDNETENKYARSARTWAEWNDDGTIVPDPRPAIYVYEQEFDLPGRGQRKRRGFFAAVKLEDFSEGGIRAHEHTFAGPKADRLNLMRATNTNLSPIFCIYDDSERNADRLIAKAIEGSTPVETAIDGITHRLWTVDDPEAAAEIVAAMKPHRLYIADGHHRYETSLNYRAEMREKSGKTGGEEPFDYTLMFLANTHDEGLEILPTHRVLSKRSCDNINIERVLKRLSTDFEVIDMDEEIADPAKAAQTLTERLEEAGRGGVSYVLLLPENRAYLLTIHKDADPDKLIPGKEIARAVKALDVTLLHRYIIQHVWLDNPKEELDDADVTYVKDASEAIRLVLSGSHGAGFLLNPTKIEQVIQIAGLGMRMPHKSTFFYPKIITGLVIRDMNRQ